jgi:hypothetical protein
MFSGRFGRLEFFHFYLGGSIVLPQTLEGRMPDIRSLEERGYDFDYRSVNSFAEAKEAEADKNVPKAAQYMKLTPIKMISMTCP